MFNKLATKTMMFLKVSKKKYEPRWFTFIRDERRLKIENFITDFQSLPLSTVYAFDNEKKVNQSKSTTTSTKLLREQRKEKQEESLMHFFSHSPNNNKHLIYGKSLTTMWWKPLRALVDHSVIRSSLSFLVISFNFLSRRILRNSKNIVFCVHLTIPAILSFVVLLLLNLNTSSDFLSFLQLMSFCNLFSFRGQIFFLMSCLLLLLQFFDAANEFFFIV